MCDFVGSPQGQSPLKALQALVSQAKAVAFPVQQFDAVARLVDEHEQGLAIRVEQ